MNAASPRLRLLEQLRDDFFLNSTQFAIYFNVVNLDFSRGSRLGISRVWQNNYKKNADLLDCGFAFGFDNFSKT